MVDEIAKILQMVTRNNETDFAYYVDQQAYLMGTISGAMQDSSEVEKLLVESGLELADVYRPADRRTIIFRLKDRQRDEPKLRALMRLFLGRTLSRRASYGTRREEARKFTDVEIFKFLDDLCTIPEAEYTQELFDFATYCCLEYRQRFGRPSESESLFQEYFSRFQKKAVGSRR